MWFDFPFAAIDQDRLHLLANEMGSNGMNIVAFIGGHKGIGAIEQIGGNSGTTIGAIFHQRRHTYAECIGNFGERSQRRHYFAAFNFGEQTFRTFTDLRNIFEGTPLLRADAANPDADVQKIDPSC